MRDRFRSSCRHPLFCIWSTLYALSLSLSPRWQQVPITHVGGIGIGGPDHISQLGPLLGLLSPDSLRVCSGPCLFLFSLPSCLCFPLVDAVSVCWVCCMFTSVFNCAHCVCVYVRSLWPACNLETLCMHHRKPCNDNKQQSIRPYMGPIHPANALTLNTLNSLSHNSILGHMHFLFSFFTRLTLQFFSRSLAQF